MIIINNCACSAFKRDEHGIIRFIGMLEPGHTMLVIDKIRYNPNHDDLYSVLLEDERELFICPFDVQEI